MLLFRTVPFGAACLFFAAGVCAQPVPSSLPGTAAVTTIPPLLKSAVLAVWKDSPDVQAGRAELEAARARARAAEQPIYNPALELDAENADVDRRTVGISLALDLSGKRRAQSDRGAAQLRISQSVFDSLRRDVAGRWLKAWSAAALAARQSELGRHRVDLMTRFDELASQRLNVGDISSSERDLAGLALAEAQIQQASLIGNEGIARASLIAIGGTDVASLPPLPDGAPPAIVGFESRPVEDLPEIREARAKLDSADAAVSVATRARIPDPTVSLTGGQVHNGPITDRVVGLKLSIPLPVLNRGRAEVDAARAEADAAGASVQSRLWALRGTQQEARVRYDALRSAVEGFHVGRAAAFEDRTTLLEKLWRAGEISTSDYLVQLKQSLDTALSGLELESRAWQAWFDYLASAGRLTEWIDGPSQDASR